MELKQYVRIAWRRWPLIAGLMVVVFLASLPGLLRPQPAVYQAAMRFAVGVVPEPRTGDYYAYDRYYTWLSSEYLVDDLAEVIKSGSFAEAVSQTLAEEGIQVPAGAISASTQAGKLHRILSVTITWGDEEQLRAIAKGVVATVQERNAEFVAQLAMQNAQAWLIDAPSVSPLGKGLRERLDLPIRLLLALLAGLALAFLLDYMDDSVRSAQEMEEMGLSVMGQVPKRHANRWWLR